MSRQTEQENSTALKIAFLIINDQEVLILRDLYEDQSPGGLRDSLECRGYELTVADRINVVNDGSFFKVIVYNDDMVREIISNGSLYCETLPIPRWT